MNRILVILAIICAVLAAIVIAVQSYRLSKANAENEKLQAKLAALENDFMRAQKDNVFLRDIVERSQKALETTVGYLERAANEDTKRIATIDDADPDWLQCSLPASVRDAFTDYCDAGDQATGNPVGAVQETDSGQAGD